MHTHRYRIPEPDGRAMLPGECECGATKLFKAGMDAYQSFHKAGGKIVGLGELRDRRVERSAW